MGDKKKASAPASTRAPTPPPSPYGKGWKRVPAEVAATHRTAGALLGAPLNLPPECLVLKDYVLSVYDQGRTSSCFANALAKAIHVRLRKIMVSGSPEPAEPSRRAIYAGARRRAMQDPKAPLVDEGSVPSDGMEFAREVGIESEARCSWDESRINEDVAWDDLQSAAKFLMFEWFRITAVGASISDAIANAISQGFPVIFGLDLWQAFEDYQGGTISRVDPDDVGGHMLCILGYRPSAQGGREFLVINSWGRWGEQGYCWIHETVFEGTSAVGRSSDYYVIQVAS